MGGCNCHKKSVPPPKFTLVGQWVLNSKSKNFRIGTGKFRYKKGTNLLGIGLSKQQNQNSVCRLIINEDGMIQFYQYSDEYWMVIDGPVYSWKNGKIKAYGGLKLEYNQTLLQRKDILIVNGLLLKRSLNVIDT